MICLANTSAATQRTHIMKIIRECGTMTTLDARESAGVDHRVGVYSLDGGA